MAGCRASGLAPPGADVAGGPGGASPQARDAAIVCAVFGIGITEMIVIGLVILMLFSPRELPGMMKTLARVYGSIRRTAEDFRAQVMEAEELREPIEEIRAAYHGTKQELMSAQDLARRELGRARAEAMKAQQKLAEIAREESRREATLKNRVSAHESEDAPAHETRNAVPTSPTAPVGSVPATPATASPAPAVTTPATSTAPIGSGPATPAPSPVGSGPATPTTPAAPAPASSLPTTTPVGSGPATPKFTAPAAPKFTVPAAPAAPPTAASEPPTVAASADRSDAA